MRAPSFICENETREGLTLHYRSKRRGFVYYAMGQIREVARHFYNKVSCTYFRFYAYSTYRLNVSMSNQMYFFHVGNGNWISKRRNSIRHCSCHFSIKIRQQSFYISVYVNDERREAFTNKRQCVIWNISILYCIQVCVIYSFLKLF